MAHLKRIAYKEPGKAQWGKSKKKVTYKLDPVTSEAISQVAHEVRVENDYKQWGDGMLIESWALNDPRTRAKIKELKKEGQYEGGGQTVNH